MPPPDLTGLVGAGGAEWAARGGSVSGLDSGLGLTQSIVGFAAALVSAGLGVLAWAAALLPVDVGCGLGVGVTTSIALRSSVAWGRLGADVSGAPVNGVVVVVALAGVALAGFGASGALSFLSIVIMALTPTHGRSNEGTAAGAKRH